MPFLSPLRTAGNPETNQHPPETANRPPENHHAVENHHLHDIKAIIPGRPIFKLLDGRWSTLRHMHIPVSRHNTWARTRQISHDRHNT